MAANVGRTTFKHVQFNISDSGDTLRSIPISSLNVVGVTYDELDLTAFQDAVKGALPSMPDAPIEIQGPFDTTTAQTVGTLSGSHTILSGINGLMVPLSLDVKIGIRQAWDTEPQFGITASATSGYLCTRYNVDINTMTYSARFVLFPGSSLPAWGTAVET